MAILSKRKQKELVAEGYDLELLKTIQPQGNMSFKPDRYYYGGDGYYTILNVYQYPTEELENFWLLDVMQIKGTRAFLSKYHENNHMLKDKLDKSIEEKETRITGNAKHTQNQKEVDEITDMAQLYREIDKKILQC